MARAELSKESFKPDSDNERRICKSLLKLINDQSSDVQARAAAAAAAMLPHKTAAHDTHTP